LCAQEHDYTDRVIRQPHLDPHRFGYIRATDREADWTDPTVWKQANPGLGQFVSKAKLAAECKEAIASPVKQKAFRQYRLNTWGLAAVNRWMQLDVWDRSAGLVSRSSLVGRDAYGGLDLASSVDIAALSWCFGEGEGDERVFDAVWRFWAPEARRLDLDERTGGQASVWAKEGFLMFTEGDVIDYEQILTDVDTDAQDFNVIELAYDRWGMTQMSQMLTDEGLTVVPMGQGYASMSPPTKAWEGLIRSERYRHGGNPVMRWMIDNVRIRSDPAGNVKIDKARSAEKVDGAVAAVMALDRCLRAGPPLRSIYEERGMMSA
jgi:phage terminase large subunit-like protein